MPWEREEMGLDDGVGEVGVGCGGRLGVRQLEVGPCGGVRREEVDEGSAYLLPVLDPSEKRSASLSDGGRGKTWSGPKLALSAAREG